MSEFPSLPLFTDAFIADTGHLSATETGAYLMLLMMAWRLPDCRIPDDDAKLARWARVDARAWSRIKPKVMEFWTLEDGHWTQKRLLLERDKVRKFADTARANGMRGGRPKSLKSQERQNPSGSSSKTQSKAPNPNPNPIEEESSEASPLRTVREAKKPVASRRKAARTPFPAGWSLSADERDFARRKQPGWSERDVDDQFDRFRDRNLATASVYADWPAAWRTWVTSPYQRPANGAVRGPPLERRNHFADIAAEAHREITDGKRPDNLRLFDPGMASGPSQSGDRYADPPLVERGRGGGGEVAAFRDFGQRRSVG